MGGVQRMISMRKEQPVDQFQQIEERPVLKENRQEASSADPVMKDDEEAPVVRTRKT